MPLPAVIDTLSELVRINSVNSAYDGGPGEAALAEWIEGFFARHHIATTRQEVFPGRSNVLARLAGRRRDRCLVLEAHMDTVSVAGMTIAPFEPIIQDGRLQGRGACDTKAGLAAMMHALVDVHEGDTPPPCDILLAAVVDEEHSFRGVLRLCDDLQADAAVVAEPTQLRAVIASKGVLRWKVRVRGKAAHSSKPQLGVNAIRHMAHVVLALESHYEALAQRSHPLLGPATCTISTIRGGVQINFVPDHCVIELDRRLLPGEDPDAVLEDCQAVLDALPDIDAIVERPPLLVDAALDTPAETAIAQACSATLGGLGLDPDPCGVPFGSDASKFSRTGVPAIIFGPGSIDRAHAADEYVEIDQVITALDFYRRLVLSFDPA
jgi:acetylornithine deacetylase